MNGLEFAEGARVATIPAPGAIGNALCRSIWWAGNGQIAYMRPVRDPERMPPVKPASWEPQAILAALEATPPFQTEVVVVNVTTGAEKVWMQGCPWGPAGEYAWHGNSIKQTTEPYVQGSLWSMAQDGSWLLWEGSLGVSHGPWKAICMSDGTVREWGMRGTGNHARWWPMWLPDHSGWACIRMNHSGMTALQMYSVADGAEPSASLEAPMGSQLVGAGVDGSLLIVHDTPVTQSELRLTVLRAEPSSDRLDTWTTITWPEPNLRRRGLPCLDGADLLAILTFDDNKRDALYLKQLGNDAPPAQILYAEPGLRVDCAAFSPSGENVAVLVGESVVLIATASPSMPSRRQL